MEKQLAKLVAQHGLENVLATLKSMKPQSAIPQPCEFDAAFRSCDCNGHNFVSLVKLRSAVACDRAAFDTLLDQLRREYRYTLSSIEGRHGTTEEERNACIREDGQLLLYVSARK